MFFWKDTVQPMTEVDREEGWGVMLADPPQEEEKGESSSSQPAVGAEGTDKLSLPRLPTSRLRIYEGISSPYCLSHA